MIDWRASCRPGATGLGLLLAAGLAGIFLSATPGAVAAPAAPGQQEVSRDFQKTVTLAAGQFLRVENKFGEVRVHGESGREVKISAIIRVQAGSREEAEAYSQKIQIEVEQSGGGLRVRTVATEDRSWNLGKRRLSYSVNYDIAMPSEAPLEVQNSFGNSTVNGVRARSVIDNNHGSLTARDIGPTRLTNSFGSIELAGASGDVAITDNNGNIDARDIKGSLDLRNRFGNITVQNVHGEVTIAGGNGNVLLSDSGTSTISTSFGNAGVRNIRGDLTLRDNNGNIEVSTVSGSATLANGYGGITISDVKGRVDCITNNGRVKGSGLGGAIAVRNSSSCTKDWARSRCGGIFPRASHARRGATRSSIRAMATATPIR